MLAVMIVPSNSLLGLASLILAGATARSMAGEFAIPVTANLEDADQNPLNTDAAAPDRKAAWQLVVRRATFPEPQSFKAYFRAALPGQAIELQV